jgi:tetratricopeptide (TPR) repeat protein
MQRSVGNALLQAGQVVEAIKQYNQALQLKPDYVEAHTNLGAVLLQESHVAEAIQQFEQALQINPDYGPAQNDLAIAQALQQAASVKK